MSAFSFFATAQITADQGVANIHMVPSVDMQGHAKAALLPDQIFITVYMIERFDGKEKVTIEFQEQALLKSLNSKGLNIDSLVLSSSRASYVRVRFRTDKDVLQRSNYEVMVRNADDAAKVFESCEELKIEDCRITRVDHSQREQVMNKLRVKALENAMQKTDDLLATAGEKRGKLLMLHEVDPAYQSMYQNQFVVQEQQFAYDKMYSSAELYTSNGFGVTFKKIELEVYIYTKFAVQ